MSARTVLVVRPEPGNAATLSAAHAAGLGAKGNPLFRIEPVAWAAPDPSCFDAILFGSANALRQGGEGLRTLTTLPAYVVGDATAAAAYAHGFAVAATGSGGLGGLLPRLAEDRRRRVLRVAGEAHVLLDPGSDLAIQTITVYRAAPLPLDAELLEDSPVVLLHSAEAARRFGDECERLGVDRSGIALACLGPRIAAAAGIGWREICTAARPDDAALLALAHKMCQMADFGVADKTD